VDPGLILETTFLVDLERELLAGRDGPAQRLLAERAAEPLYITPVVAGELAAGAATDGRHRWEESVAPFEVLPITPDVSWEYGQAARYLRANGLLIGANDLWIAAAALAYGKPPAR
jgi:predicted nucleic acid-binding protein